MINNTAIAGLVSVIIPSYNRAEFIAETIQSVIDQSYTRWEIIVVDDGSTDDTANIVRNINHPNIYFYQLSHTGRSGFVRHQGVLKSKGEIIAFLDSDDLWRADKLDLQMELFKLNPDAAFIISNGSEFGDTAIETPNYESLFKGNMFLRILEQGDFCCYTPTFAFRREAVEAVTPPIDNDSSLQDIHFFFLMSFRFTGIFTNEKLAHIRKHKTSHSKNTSDYAYRDTFPMLRDFLEKEMLSKKQFHQLTALNHYRQGIFWLGKKHHAKAARAFLKYNLLKPGQMKGYLRFAQSVLLIIPYSFK